MKNDTCLTIIASNLSLKRECGPKGQVKFAWNRPLFFLCKKPVLGSALGYYTSLLLICPFSTGPFSYASLFFTHPFFLRIHVYYATCFFCVPVPMHPGSYASLALMHPWLLCIPGSYASRALMRPWSLFVPVSHVPLFPMHLRRQPNMR